MVNTTLMKRFWEVVVSILMKEKSEIWSTRDRRKPAPVFATDSTRDIDRVCLVIGIQIGGREDHPRVIMPAPIPALDGDRLDLLGNDAVVQVIEALESGMARNHDLDLFLGSGPCHRGR